MCDIKLGSKGTEVAAIVQQLRKLGFPLEQTDEFGSKVRKSIEAFQASNVDASGQRLEVDGIVGPKTLLALDAAQAIFFEDVQPVEQDRLGIRRSRSDVRNVDGAMVGASDSGSTNTLRMTYGLALSGGGIRSATFALGCLQALASASRLQRFDYLSTVSGGGYIGGWLSAWIYRKGSKTVFDALSQSTTLPRREPQEIQWLRRYSNYLTPRVGALSLDSATVAATLIRNLLLNLIILASFVGALLLLPRLVAEALTNYSGDSFGATLAGAIMVILALTVIAANLTLEFYDSSTVPVGADRYKLLGTLSTQTVARLAIGPAFAACIALTFGALTVDDWTVGTVILEGGVGIAVFFLVAGSLWLYFRWANQYNAQVFRKTEVDPKASINAKLTVAQLLTDIRGLSPSISFSYLIFVTASLVLNILILYGVNQLWHVVQFSITDPSAQNQLKVSFGPPLVALSFGLCLFIAIGLIGRAYAESSREWMSRFAATLMIASIAWGGWCGMAFYSPYIFSHAKLMVGWIASISWLSGLLGSIVLWRIQTGGKANSPAWQSYLLTLSAALLAAMTVVLIAIGISLATASISGLGVTMAIASLLVFAMCLAMTGLFGWRVDVNKFSLHDMYKLRLIRCYLGASHERRCPQPFTGFDARDDVPLAKLATQKPMHIFGTALNLTQGGELAWQQRKAASFVFTPLYCGFQLSPDQDTHPVHDDGIIAPGYRATKVYASRTQDGSVASGLHPEGMTIGMAMATSGAAVSPNMGAQSKPVLSFLMTFLNIRLGRWSPNSARARYMLTSPVFGLSYLLAELFGLSNEDRDFIYLSDGGHFENTGVYELVRRECDRILVVDSGADPTRSFEDIGNMLHKCRVDFGAQIDLDITKLLGNESMRSEAAFITGEISYASGRSGQLLVIKPSLPRDGGESADILHYSRSNASFPQQTTADQWFDETQFECYRKLGFDLAKNAIEGATGFWNTTTPDP